eukprot:TRINITY_DN28484_c0_g1_i1.p2 TRINITY_DN28484_c0_g1~~TRINITY_DN28484_c0_g1_i1.p2  ORF type:complete len:277 (+),score=56.73 TRINITY_DN28484_c0_g1_i1:48-878(+)
MSTLTVGRRNRFPKPSKAAKNNRYQGRREERTPVGPVIWRACTRLFGALLVLTLLAGISLGLLTAYRWMTAHPYFALQEIEVVGNHRLGQGEILSIAEVAMGQNSLDVNMSEMEERLSANPWVQSVTLRRTLPGTLTIIIREREARYWIRRSNQLWYADVQGQPIEPVGQAKFVSLPFLDTGPQANETIVRNFTNALNSGQWSFGPEAVDTVSISERDGLNVALNNPRMTLSTDLNNWQQAFERMVTVMNDLAARKELHRTVRISSQDDRVWAQLD